VGGRDRAGDVDLSETAEALSQGIVVHTGLVIAATTGRDMGVDDMLARSHRAAVQTEYSPRPYPPVTRMR
jgi:hypothetical protein